MSKPSKRGLVTLLLIVVTLALGGWAFLDTFSNVGYAPIQPIPFSHKLHAGTRKIPCLYCHSNAERSRHATIPSTNVCMNCHLVVRTDKPAIQQVTKLYEEGKPIPWVRVYRIPSFVYFSHRVHTAAGTACETCHGPVRERDVITKEVSHNMQSCVACHTAKSARSGCTTCHEER